MQPLSQGLGPQPIKESPGAKIALRYVGPKQQKTDTLFGTRVTWRGPGDVQEVPAHLVKRFLAFPTVWQLPDAPWTAPQRPIKPAAVADMVRDGLWDAIAQVAPEVYARAEAFFAERLAGREPPGPGPVTAEVQQDAGQILTDPKARQLWAENILDGSARWVKDRLQEHADELTQDPSLFEVLGQTETAGKNRRQVLDIIEAAETAALNPQNSLPVDHGGA